MPTSIKRGSETVLLVEDEDMVRKLASELLAESGYRVLEANGGEAAIHLGKEHTERIDLLITDVVMPKLSGKEVAEQLRAIHPETRVLFMSGIPTKQSCTTALWIRHCFHPKAIFRKGPGTKDSGRVGHYQRSRVIGLAMASAVACWIVDRLRTGQ